MATTTAPMPAASLLGEVRQAEARDLDAARAADNAEFYGTASPERVAELEALSANAAKTLCEAEDALITGGAETLEDITAKQAYLVTWLEGCDGYAERLARAILNDLKRLAPKGVA